MAIGGDFFTGYENASLYRDGQTKSVPELLSRQFELVGGGVFSQPLMPDDDGLGLNAKPWESDFNARSELGYKTDCEGTEGLSPLKTLFDKDVATSYLSRVGSGYHNLAVPHAKIKDFFDPNLGISWSDGNSNPYYHRFATSPGNSTVAEDALAQNPTFGLFWAGMEDIFEYARFGGRGQTLLSSSEFSNYLDSLISPFIANGAKGAIANIPDLENFPYYTLVEYNRAELSLGQADSLNEQYEVGGADHIVFAEGKNAFVISDTSHVMGFRQMEEGEYILLTVPLDSMRCFFYGLLINLIHDRYSLDQYEMQLIHDAIDGYNQAIQQKADEYDLALVDMNAYFKSVKSGIKWNGVDFDSEFVSGGFFSLDGYHPNQKGYALITNEFIKAINGKYNAVIPTVNCFDCKGVEFP
ncbi:hypothetical protein JYU20_03400 [Bacteroidales bacterium AH-315-I05]|nr:hypothetical protein [Bacteroidales bacterium AH-315-I05]